MFYKIFMLNLGLFKVVFNVIYDSNILGYLLLVYFIFFDLLLMFFEKIKLLINFLKFG